MCTFWGKFITSSEYIVRDTQFTFVKKPYRNIKLISVIDMEKNTIKK